MVRKLPIEQDLANRLKIARTLIRLKHSIAADNELNEKLEAAEKKFWKTVHQGKLPAVSISPDALDKIFDV